LISKHDEICSSTTEESRMKAVEVLAVEVRGREREKTDMIEKELPLRRALIYLP